MNCAPRPIVSSSGWATMMATVRASQSSIPPGHPAAEVGVSLDIAGRAGMVRPQPFRIRRKTICQRHVEFVERLHLAVEPALCARTQAVGPAQPGPQTLHAEVAQPAHALLKARILEMEPLADP